MKTTERKIIKHQCNQCRADLIWVKEIVEDKDLPSPITTTIYRCSNRTCQKDIDKKGLELQAKYYKRQEDRRGRRNETRS